MAKELPRENDPQPARGYFHKLFHGMENLRDGRTPEYWYRLQSSAATLIGHFTDFFPGSTECFRLKAIALESRHPEPKYTFLFPFVDGTPQTFLNQSLNACPLLVCNIACLF